jgi:hypothetical protein
LPSRYAELGLFPISVKQYFSDRCLREADHLAAFLRQGGTVSNWRLPARPYDPETDRPALDLYKQDYHDLLRFQRRMGPS